MNNDLEVGISIANSLYLEGGCEVVPITSAISHGNGISNNSKRNTKTKTDNAVVKYFL